MKVFQSPYRWRFLVHYKHRGEIVCGTAIRLTQVERRVTVDPAKVSCRKCVEWVKRIEDAKVPPCVS